MLYFLGCNWQKLPKLIKYFKEHSAGARRAKISEDYVAICKPGQSYISNIEKCQSSPYGYALHLHHPKTPFNTQRVINTVKTKTT